MFHTNKEPLVDAFHSITHWNSSLKAYDFPYHMLYGRFPDSCPFNWVVFFTTDLNIQRYMVMVHLIEWMNDPLFFVLLGTFSRGFDVQPRVFCPMNNFRFWLGAGPTAIAHHNLHDFPLWQTRKRANKLPKWLFQISKLTDETLFCLNLPNA